MFINKTPVKLLCCVFRACNFKYIAIQWEEPASYGDALIVGYKVFINGVVEAVLGQDQRSYSFTNGKWCKEYIFQVQALTNNDVYRLGRAGFSAAGVFHERPFQIFRQD